MNNTILKEDNKIFVRFSNFKRYNSLSPKELIAKYKLDSDGKNSFDITNEIDKIAYNL